MTDLVAIARSLFAPGKGLLALDESVATATARLGQYGVSAGEEGRRQYRDLFLGAPGVEAYLSGVILFEETLRQKGSDRKLFPKSLEARGVMPGIKVDQGREPFAESPQEMITKGLLDLPERLEAYKKQGALFTKWRATFQIEGDHLPTAKAIHENAKRMAAYAKAVQTAGLIPIIEPEVLWEGRHGRARQRAVLEQVLGPVFAILGEHAVDLSALVLKTSMVLSGAGSGRADSPEEVAEDTLATLSASVPREVSGIVFLSGGQSPDQATDNLSAICRSPRRGGGTPWPITFSFARALQEEALALWQGKEENVEAAREAFLARLNKVSAASKGES